MAHITTALASELITGYTYTIDYVGTANWVAMGAASATHGITFVKNSTVPTGTGTATYNTLNPSIALDVQSLDPGALIELYELDTTRYAGGTIYRFHSDVNTLQTRVVWQGNTYQPFPIEVSGFETNGTGAPPRPRITLANISGYVGALAISLNDLVSCKLTRKRTFVKYLDAVNFTGGVNPTADINAHFPDEIFLIDRKVSENKVNVEFELASVLDMTGVFLPRRQVIANVCTWQYRSAECGYTGGPVANELDVKCAAIGGTEPDAHDKCSKHLHACEMRFGNTPLPFGGFPAVGKIK